MPLATLPGGNLGGPGSPANLALFTLPGAPGSPYSAAGRGIFADAGPDGKIPGFPCSARAGLGPVDPGLANKSGPAWSALALRRSCGVEPDAEGGLYWGPPNPFGRMKMRSARALQVD